MSQAEELLNSMSEDVLEHVHPVTDSDAYFIIDPITRQIENTNRKKNVIMQFDHNSERITFELPRYVDGHDMLECTSVTVNVDNIEVVEPVDGEEVVEPRVNSDASDIADLRVHPNDSEKVIVSWLISRNSTQLAGILSFHIEFKCVDSSGNVVYEWSTDTYSEIAVKARKKNSEAAVIEHSDLLEQWRTRIFGAGDSVMANIAAEGKAQVAAVRNETEALLEAVQTKSDAIVCEAAGDSIMLKDSSDDYIRGLKLYGKSTQDGVPTPDNPVEIVSVENPLVMVSGGNLISPIDMIAGDMSVPSDRIYCGPNCKLTVRVTKSRVDGATITNNRVYPCVLMEKDESGNETPTYPESVYLPSGSGTYEVIFTTKPTTKSIRVNFTNNNSDRNLNTRISNVSVSIGTTIIGDEYVDGDNLLFNCILSGIPVTSGGNYTDSDGQQWICDEIDLERGVYVQRLHIDTVSSERINSVDNAYVSTGGSIAYFVPAYQHMQNDDVLLVMSNWCTGIPCKERNTHTDEYRCYAPASDPNVLTLRYPISAGEKTLEEVKVDFSGRSVMYVLREPIETPLTAEEITAFKALRTNYPNTTILNDAGAWMSVKYNADTKSYVENPRILKLADSSTGVVYELKIVNGSITITPV